MICLVCRQAETFDGFTIVVFERGEFRLIVKDVPARVCHNCGEAYMQQAVAEHLLRLAREMSEAGPLDTQCEYSAL
jgi:YgiT-type zinc finger domain-containing protein